MFTKDAFLLLHLEKIYVILTLAKLRMFCALRFMHHKAETNLLIYRKRIVRCSKMKQNLHPEYNEAVVKCACGHTFTTRSTKSELKVDICSKCHPFFTGKQKLVDAGGRVDKFNKKFNLGK